MFEDRVDESHLSMLEQFEHDVKAFVDFGLFFSAFANAGVALAGTTNLTWIVLLALVLGKTSATPRSRSWTRNGASRLPPA